MCPYVRCSRSDRVSLCCSIFTRVITKLGEVQSFTDDGLAVGHVVLASPFPAESTLKVCASPGYFGIDFKQTAELFISRDRNGIKEKYANSFITPPQLASVKNFVASEVGNFPTRKTIQFCVIFLLTSPRHAPSMRIQLVRL